MKNYKKYIMSFLIMMVAFTACAKTKSDTKETMTKPSKIQFIELGSVRCIPCKMMALIVENIKTSYAEKIDVIFYDVWTDAGSVYGEYYKIQSIPTQVFIDAAGKEYFRHEGFFAEEDIRKVLTEMGV